MAYFSANEKELMNKLIMQREERGCRTKFLRKVGRGDRRDGFR